MKKIVIIGAGAMGSAFTVPCVDNSNEVTLVGTHLENELIQSIKKNKNWKDKKVKARFVCVLSIYWPSGKNISKTGKIEGFISPKKKGKNGFGYDPIFIPNKRKITFAQMLPKEKFKIDHRSKAYRKIKKFGILSVSNKLYVLSLTPTICFGKSLTNFSII